MSGSEEKPRDVPFVEKLIAGVGLTLVVLVAGSLGYEALTHSGGPPDVEVQVGGIHRSRSGYLVRFTAFNGGETTAAQVQIEGELRDGDQVVEESATTLRFVPDGGNQEGGLFFERDPHRYRLHLRATGYEKP
jgi:uncharacterized protein (TIGR02588 family)